MKITWDDLLIPIESTEPQRSLADWAWLITTSCRPVAISSFGDWFLQLKNGTVSQLSMVHGTFQQVASDFDQFQKQMNTRSWQESHLLSDIRFILKQKNLTLNPGQTFAFKIHPRIGGEVSSTNVITMHLVVWNSICGQLFHQMGQP